MTPRVSVCLLLLACLQVNAADWVMYSAESKLGFTASYDGGGFSGEFESFEVSLDFDTDSPATAVLEVSVDVTSVNTQNSDRDSALAGSDWFDFDTHPVASYRVSGFQHRGGNDYVANGALTLKGAIRDVPIEFTYTVTEDAVSVRGRAIMAGHAEINRMDFNVGSGDWEDPDLIGHEVYVEFDLKLTEAEG